MLNDSVLKNGFFDNHPMYLKNLTLCGTLNTSVFVHEVVYFDGEHHKGDDIYIRIIACWASVCE